MISLSEINRSLQCHFEYFSIWMKKHFYYQHITETNQWQSTNIFSGCMSNFALLSESCGNFCTLVNHTVCFKKVCLDWVSTSYKCVTLCAASTKPLRMKNMFSGGEPYLVFKGEDLLAAPRSREKLFSTTFCAHLWL